MSVQIEKLGKNMAKLTIEVATDKFEAAIEQAYHRLKGRIQLPGFRKGKAPRRMIEKVYGASIFFEDAADILIPKAYEEALAECGETIVSRPEIDITQAESGKPFIFTAEVALKPEVVLGEYKGLEVPASEITVTDEEVEAEVKRQQEQNARTIEITDRPVQDGDLIKLDFEGSVDGVPFDGGKGTDYPLTIGSGSFIPGFEEQLIGHSIGEPVSVTVTFPEDYHAKDLAGKEAVFACEIKSISVKELPEADDEFAQDVSEFETLEEYKADIRARLTSQKEEQAKAAKQNAAVEKAVANAQMDIPEAMIQEQIRRMIQEMTRNMQAQGISMEQYMQYTGMTQEKLEEQMRPDALRRIQNSLVLEAVAAAEGIVISDERLDEELAKMAEQYGMEVDKLKEMMGEEEKEQMKSDLALQAAADLIAEAAVEA